MLQCQLFLVSIFSKLINLTINLTKICQENQKLYATTIQ